MEQDAGRRQRREQTRAQVEQVALEVFREHGFDSVTVEQICAAAGIGPATFYRYFGTKDGVLFAYRQDFLRVIGEVVARLPPGLSRAQQVRAALHGFLEFLDEHAGAIAARDDIVARNPALLARTLMVQREWEGALASALAAARAVPPTDPAAGLDAALALLVVRLAFRRWRAGCSPSLAGAVAAAADEVAEAQAALGPA